MIMHVMYVVVGSIFPGSSLARTQRIVSYSVDLFLSFYIYIYIYIYPITIVRGLYFIWIGHMIKLVVVLIWMSIFTLCMVYRYIYLYLFISIDMYRMQVDHDLDFHVRKIQALFRGRKDRLLLLGIRRQTVERPSSVLPALLEVRKIRIATFLSGMKARYKIQEIDRYRYTDK